MKAMLVRDIRKVETTPERFSCEMGISMEQADRTLAFAMNPETPEDCIAILDEAVLSDCTVVVAGNVIDEGKTAVQEFLRDYGM